MVMWYQRQHGKSEKWALANYKQLYGVWPREASMGLWKNYFKPPDMELASWIQSRRIAFARRKNGNRWKDDNIQNDRVNGNGHTVPKGAIDERAQVLVDRASERVEGTLMTREDFENFG
jgi:hypothetical protein